MKDYKPGIITCLVFIASLVLMLNFEPHEVIKSSPALVRLITLVWAMVFAIGTYSKWTLFFDAVKELIADLTHIGSDIAAAAKIQGSLFDRAKYVFNAAPLMLWSLCWVAFTQIMCSFYIAEWCY